MTTHYAIAALTLAGIAQAQSVDGFTLIDAATDAPVAVFDPLTEASEINLADLASSQLNITAQTTPSMVGSVVFTLSGAEAQQQTENVAPYALFGDTNGDFNAWTPTAGAYTLTATAFSGMNGAGTTDGPLTINFTIIDDPGQANTPPEVNAGAVQTLPASATQTTLTGAATDDNAVASTLWTQAAGPPATIIDATALATDVTGLSEAFYVFRLTATDDEGASASDDVVIRVGDPTSTAEVGGEQRVWQTLTLTYEGPPTSEGDAANPFLDYRMDVTFTNGAATYTVPGYYAADGDALNTGATSGASWRVKFTPDAPGAWMFTTSFRTGTNVAVDDDPLAGAPALFDGDSGEIQIAPRDPSLPGFFSAGRLAYDGGHYLRFLGSGEPYVKGGADSPENWLGYTGFDNTFDGGAGPSTPDGLHAFPTHVMDWNPGDPDWDRNDPPGTNDGRAIIGALNYLASTGVNSIYFLPMNIGGDAQDSWPYVGPINPDGAASNDNTRFDVSKLEQWEVFFEHAQRKGLLLHFVLNEAEAPNKQELDNAQLGVERRLFYREIIARFGHHNAIVWNICEEYNLGLDLGSGRVLEWAEFIKSVDPYGRPVTVHNAGNPNNPNSGPWAPFIGQDNIDLTSLQNARQNTGWSDVVEAYRTASDAAGKPIPVMIDEPGSPTRDFNDDFDAFRKSIIWPVLLSGGGGEWFINNRDQSLEDFREFDQLWRETGHTLTFINTYLPIDLMEPDDTIISGANAGFDGPQAMAIEGEIYALYIPAGGDVSIDLGAASETFDVRWYDPCAGGALQTGSVESVSGPGAVAIGQPPSTPADDWAVLLTLQITTCTGDLNADGDVSADDLAILLAAWGGNGDADLDASGAVDSSDLAILLAAWGPCP